MDHCPYPPNPIYPRVKIPYLDHPPFDNGDFSSFPWRQGWDKREFLTGELRSGTPEKAAAFLQSWLFFGLAGTILKNCFGPNISDLKEVFVIQDPENTNSYIISTEKLRPALDTWVSKTVDSGNEEAKKALQRVADLLDETSVFSQAMETTTGSGFRLDEKYPEVRLSIMALADQIWSTARYIEQELASTVHRAAETVSNLVGGKKSYLGKLVGKVEKSATKALESKQKGTLFAAGSSWMLGKTYGVENEQDNEWGKMIMYNSIRTPEMDTDRPICGWWKWGQSAILRSRLIDAGWCPYEAERAQDLMSPWAVHFASALKWTQFTTLSHKDCTTTYCSAHQIDESTYRTQHVTPDCTCDFIGLPPEPMHQLLNEGRFPIVLAALNVDTGDIEIEVTDRRYNKGRYIAISHVWSHGLGNAKENKLPKCQLARIINLIRERDIASGSENMNLASNAPKIGNKIVARFWIDTLCIPLEPNYRRMAINSMSQVYAASAILIALDSALLSIALKDISELEACVRIYCSAWIQRMWTMQEGASNHDLRIAFADGNVGQANWAHEKFVRRDQPLPLMGMYFDLLYNMIYSSYKNDSSASAVPSWLTKETWRQMVDCRRLSRLWNGLAWRASTRSSDQPLIVSAMDFGRFDFSNIPKRPDSLTHTEYGKYDAKFKLVNATPKEERWMVYYREHEYYPQGILFVNCETLSNSGYRWAPCEVGTSHRTILDITPAKVTPRGLVVKLPGYAFLSLMTPLKANFEFQDTTSKEWYSVRPMKDGDTSGWPVFAEGTTELDTKVKYALIQSGRRATYSAVAALLVIIEKSEEGVHYVRFSKRVFMARHFEGRKAELDAWLVANPKLVYGQASIVRAESYEETQFWCVG